MSEYVFKSYGLTKQYGRQKAVDNISMSVKKGEIYGFIGRNGAGKTTLMKLVMGLSSPTSGEFELFGGKGAAHLEKSRRRIGSMIESPAMYPNLTAYQNLEYTRKLYGIVENNVNAVLEQVGLDSTGSKQAGKFSMGMKQRLGLGMALMIKPDFLLLDEPVNGLDPQGTVEIRRLILELNKENNITILISSHMLDELSRIATCYGIIKEGRLIEEITATKLHEKCASYIEMDVDNPERAAYLLENELRITKFEVRPGNIVMVYDLDTKPSVINSCMLQNQVLVNSFEMKGTSLEDYFISLDSVSDSKGGVRIA